MIDRSEIVSATATAMPEDRVDDQAAAATTEQPAEQPPQAAQRIGGDRDGDPLDGGSCGLRSTRRHGTGSALGGSVDARARHAATTHEEERQHQRPLAGEDPEVADRREAPREGEHVGQREARPALAEGAQHARAGGARSRRATMTARHDALGGGEGLEPVGLPRERPGDDGDDARRSGRPGCSVSGGVNSEPPVESSAG